MKRILMIEVGPRGKDSASGSVADTLVARLTDLYPSAKLTRRDLAADHLPHLDGITLRAISTRDPEEAERLKEAARHSDQLTDELLESDLLVMATPMWNFGIPSMLKAWLDLVVRPGRTFRYSDGGVVGLAKDKKAILVLASGGVFTDGLWRPWDFVEPYLRQILGFIGIVDVQTVRVEGMNIPLLAGNAVLKANRLSRNLFCKDRSRPTELDDLQNPFAIPGIRPQRDVGRPPVSAAVTELRGVAIDGLEPGLGSDKSAERLQALPRDREKAIAAGCHGA